MGIFKRTHKEIKKGKLSNIKVDLISLLVDDMKPANGKGVVVKCDGKKYVYNGSTTKIKTVDEGRIHITIYEPDVLDSQGDFTTAEEIQKACDSFAQSGMIRKNDINHDMQPVEHCFVAESYILKTEDKKHFPDTKIGSWVAVIKCDTDSDLWKKAKEGKINGASLYGKAEDDNSVDFEPYKAEIQKKIDELEAKNDEKNKETIAVLKSMLQDYEDKEKSKISDKQFEQLEGKFEKMMTILNKGIDVTIKGEDKSENEESELTVNGTKVVLKRKYSELNKSIGGVDSGTRTNILTDNLGQQFVDTVVDFAPEDTFKDITVGELGKDEQLDIGFIEDLILKNKKDGKISGQKVGEFDLSVPTEILKGRLSLSQDTVEFYRDKLGDEAFGAYVVAVLRNKLQKALKKLFFKGDRASTDESLKALDGVLKKMKGNPEYKVTPKGNNFKYSEALSLCLKEFTNDQLDDLDRFVIYCSPKTHLDIQDEYSKRTTALGDKFVVSNSELTFKGMKVKMRQMPDDVFIIGLPNFLILGYRTDATMKCEHDGDEWIWKWNVRVRFGTQYVSGGSVRCFEFTTVQTP